MTSPPISAPVGERGKFDADLLARRDGWRMYAVKGDGRIWQVHHHFLRDEWCIQNRHGTPVDPYGKLGEKIVAACEMKFAALEKYS